MAVNTTGPWLLHQQQAAQAAQMGNGPNAGGLGGQGSLAQLGQQLGIYNPPQGGGVTGTVYTTVQIYRDPATDQWATKIYAFQNGEMFVLYDGPFPITKEGLLQHFATLTTEALNEE